jgi:hypothetical protein
MSKELLTKFLTGKSQAQKKTSNKGKGKVHPITCHESVERE